MAITIKTETASNIINQVLDGLVDAFGDFILICFRRAGCYIKYVLASYLVEVILILIAGSVRLFTTCLLVSRSTGRINIFSPG